MKKWQSHRGGAKARSQRGGKRKGVERVGGLALRDVAIGGDAAIIAETQRRREYRGGRKKFRALREPRESEGWRLRMSSGDEEMAISPRRREGAESTRRKEEGDRESRRAGASGCRHWLGCCDFRRDAEAPRVSGRKEEV